MDNSEESERQLSRICPMCHGKMIKAKLKAPGVGNDVYVELPRHTEVSNRCLLAPAFVCISCGYVQIYAVLDFHS
jgi:hypothetical protein